MKTQVTKKLLVPLLLMGTIGACASIPPPNDKITVAQTSIERAERAGAVELAALQMQSAREKLAHAKQAVADKHNDVAARLAEQADADAQLAEALAQTAKADKSVADLHDSLRTLKDESRRDDEPTNPSGVPAR
jgi:hypothetical protein